MLARSSLLGALALSGCSLIVDFDFDAGDGLPDAQLDAHVELDGGRDAGRDAGSDGGLDGGGDAGGICDGVTCDEPPAPICEDSVQVVAATTGSCVDDEGEARCEYELTRTDCATLDLACESGECVDPCEDVTCDEAPVPTCDGATTRVVFAETGTCSSPDGVPSCEYARTETDCAATDQFCDAGVCVDEDPCDGVTCTTPPSPVCETMTAVTFADTGTCSSPDGDAICEYARTEVDCAATNEACVSGACVDPCVDFTCASPPTAACEDDTAVTYEATGSCSSPGGVPECAYTRIETVCETTEVCASGACVDPCVGFACASPPAATCEDDTAVTYASTGTCSSPGGLPACAYARTDTDCAATDLACASGACVDPCVGFACESPPEPTCEDDAAVTYASPGTCSSPGGVPACDYARTDTDCTATDDACVSGACVDPCAGFSCNSPPADTCTGATTGVTYPSSGTCSSPGGTPACSYAPTPLDCGELECSAGACVDPCAGFSCDSPPADTCTGATTGVTYASTGTCTPLDGAATCSYAPTPLDCGDDPCSDGTCVDPCEGVTCNTPPPAICTDPTTAETYAALGVCAASGGAPSCSYAPTSVDCGASDQACDAGSCVDPCTGSSCTTPPAAACEADNVLRTYSSPGDCASPGGMVACEYAFTDVDCGASDEQCVSGACVDPCVGVTCDMPPADFCDGTTAVAHPAGECVSPGGEVSCSYPEARIDCAASSTACIGGACVDLCEGVSCDTPPAPSCDDEGTERVAAASGSCDFTDGICDFATTVEACASDELCVAGTGCVACDASTCGSPRCATTPVCVFGYNFDFEDWSQSDPPVAFTKPTASLFSIVREETTVSRGSSSAAVTFSVTGTSTNRDLVHVNHTSIQPSTRYTVHGWVLDDAAVRARVAWRRVGFAATNIYSNYSADSPDWQELTGSLLTSSILPADALAEVLVRSNTETSGATGGTYYLDDLALTAPHPWTMDGALDAGAYEVAAADTRYIEAGLNDDGVLYVAHPTIAARDRYLFIWVGDPDPTATVPAMWAKGGTVAAPSASGALFVLAQEEGDDGTYSEWLQWNGGAWVVVTGSRWASNADGLVEGELDLVARLGLTNARQLPRHLFVASVAYGTDNGAPPEASTQLPAFTADDGNVTADETLSLHRATILAGRLGLAL